MGPAIKVSATMTINKGMKEALAGGLRDYIEGNHPDILFSLEEEGSLAGFLEEKISGIGPLIQQLSSVKKPAYIIEEQCMAVLIKEIGPSRFNFINRVLEEEFEGIYGQLIKTGTLKFEVANLKEYCRPLFNGFGFTDESDDNRMLRWAITGAISEYLEENN